MNVYQNNECTNPGGNHINNLWINLVEFWVHAHLHATRITWCARAHCSHARWECMDPPVTHRLLWSWGLYCYCEFRKQRKVRCLNLAQLLLQIAILLQALSVSMFVHLHTNGSAFAEHSCKQWACSHRQYDQRMNIWAGREKHRRCISMWLPNVNLLSALLDYTGAF